MNTPTDRRIVLGLAAQPFLAFGLGAAVAATVACAVALPMVIWLRGRGWLAVVRS